MLFIEISEPVRAGLARMMDAMLVEKHQFVVCRHVDLALATLIIYLAKMADDYSVEWFPKGKWTTIQILEDKVDQVLGVKKSMQADGERAMYHVAPDLAGQPCTIKYRIPEQGSQSARACIRLDGGLGDIFVPAHCLKPIGTDE